MESFKMLLHKQIYGSRQITEKYFYIIFLALNFSGSNIFHDKWKLNLLTLYHITTSIGVYILISYNIIKKATSPVGFEFPEDLHFCTIWSGFTIAMLGIYIILANRKALRDVYDCVFIEFYAWFSSDIVKIAKYNKKANRLWWWNKFLVAEIECTVLMVLFRPMLDSSTLPFYDNVSQIPGLTYTTAIHHSIYAAQVFTGLTVSLLMFGIDMIFVKTLSHMSADLFMLGEDLEEASHSKDDVTIRKALKTFAIRHNAINKCLQRLNDAYKPQSLLIPTLALVFSSGSLLAFDGTRSTAEAIGIAASHALHVLNYCLPAQCITEESENLFVRIMHCNWHSWPINHQKSLFFIMHRLQKPMGIQCGIRGNFSLQMFGSFLQTLYRIYNTARQYK